MTDYQFIRMDQADGVARITQDHECTTAAEALEKLQVGMAVALRHGSAAKDLPRVLPGLLAAHPGLERVLLCTAYRRVRLLDVGEVRPQGGLVHALELGVLTGAVEDDGDVDGCGFGLLGVHGSSFELVDTRIVTTGCDRIPPTGANHTDVVH